MNYTDYKNSRDLAWEVLINEHVTELPVMVGALCRNMGIRVQFYEPEGEGDGVSTIIDGQAHIFVSKHCSPERQRFTAATIPVLLLMITEAFCFSEIHIPFCSSDKIPVAYSA